MKASKPAKVQVPEEQQELKTECGLCHNVFPNPTLARIHLDEEHPGGYSR